MSKVISIETITSLAKRRGFVFQSSEIYGGVSGFYDYGPYGSQLAKNIKDAWWKYFVEDVPNIFGLDSSIIQHPKLWEASGHVAGFNDPMVECGNCQSRVRADHLAGVDSTDLQALDELIKEKKCPNCGKSGKFSKARRFNMMLKTYLGPLEDDNSLAYLRPETAGGIFTNYELVRESARAKIPFGIGQIGKAFRNEISPRDFIFRVRELEQMEMQYFIDPKNDMEEYENLRKFNMSFLVDKIGLDSKNLKWHEHGKDELAHYAKTAHDIYFEFPFGSKELMGTHHRSDHDLKSHMEYSGKDLRYFEPKTNEHYLPYVMESSVGHGRLFLAVLCDSYTEEEVKGETRVVLKISSELAPVDVAILPLSKNEELSPLAKEVYKLVSSKSRYIAEYDETQSIGKRYRRQDEIGTPHCVTVDFDSLEDKSVTIRDRDSMKQERVPIDNIIDYIDKQRAS